MLAIEILMQAVAIVSRVPQQEGCGPCLSRVVTLRQKIRMGLGILNLHSHRVIPPVGDGDQPLVCLCPEPFDQVWQGIVKVLILAASESVSCHHYTTAEELLEDAISLGTQFLR